MKRKPLPQKTLEAPIGDDRGRLTTVQFAGYLGVTRATLDEWRRAGMPCDVEQGGDGRKRRLYHPPTIKAWLRAQGNHKRADTIAGPEGSTAPASDASRDVADVRADILRADLRRKLADAEKREHELAERRGIYLLASDVQAGRIRRIAALRASLCAIPARVAAALAHRDERHIERVLAEEIERTLRTFAEEQQVTGPDDGRRQVQAPA